MSSRLRKAVLERPHEIEFSLARVSSRICRAAGNSVCAGSSWHCAQARSRLAKQAKQAEKKQAKHRPIHGPNYNPPYAAHRGRRQFRSGAARGEPGRSRGIRRR